MCLLTFGRHAQVGQDDLHGVGLDPEDVAGHSFVVQKSGCGEDARPVVDLKMTWKHQEESGENERWDLNGSCV